MFIESTHFLVMIVDGLMMIVDVLVKKVDGLMMIVDGLVYTFNHRNPHRFAILYQTTPLSLFFVIFEVQN